MSSQDLTPMIRRAVDSDAEAVCQLLDEQNRFHVQLLPEVFTRSPTDRSRVRQVLGDTDADLFVAELGGVIVGLVELRVVHTKELPVLVQKKYVYVQEMIVAEGLRGHGIGSLLMESARHWARERGAQSIRTSVVPSNRRARSFYAREGFAEIMISLEAML